MLKRNKRIGKRGNIDEIIKKGKESQSRFLVLRTRENELGFNRFAVIVSTKLDKKAVGRNRLRRQIYESIRLLEKSEEIKNKSLDIIVFARKSLLGKNYTEIETAVKEILKNI